MAIFDLEKDDLLRLTDVQLEELIARLSEAEVAALGHSPACVGWSGSIKSPDGGIDVHVQIPYAALIPGFIVRAETVLQSKKDSMPKSAIASEMRSSEGLAPMISGLAERGGSYIIVSLADDCSPTMKSERLAAMRDAVADDPNKDRIHLDFYDRSKLLLWLRQHPSVMLWVKGKIGQGYSGWQPYGAWSKPPKGTNDTLISAQGVNVLLPSQGGQKLSIGDAIVPMRQLVKASSKAIRVTGLSGVGKTRIVQALFDETIEETPLDRTIAVYVDTGDDPTPSAAAMLDRLLAEGRKAIMILDNCPSDLHSALAGKVSASSSNVKLITVEYDIRDDKPQTTDVVHIEADGPEVAEELLLRRFPSVGQVNARRIAEFANGNARVSLAIAERVEQGESLAHLSDAELFDRLFEQRKERDGNLRSQAETLSLAYSFSVSAPKDGLDELAVLGSISGHTKAQLFRSVKQLADRHVVQKRSHWRAVLPHAIANKLASSALESVPVDTLREVFEASGNQRLLMSFAHRLGLMHDHPVAKEIADAWLQPDGLLGRVLDLNEEGARILDYIGPVAPETLLDRIETELAASGFRALGQRPRRTTILNLVQSLAYEPEMFDRCMNLLIGVADHEDENNNHDTARGKIGGFFQPYLSGTHASLAQRLAVIERCVSSDTAARRSLGINLLSIALDGPPWTGLGLNEFGARPRDYGYHPNHDQLVEWRAAFIDVAVRLGVSGDVELNSKARLVLANEFRGLWHQRAMREKLIDVAYVLNSHQPWGEGWRAIRSTIYFDYTKRNDKQGPRPVPENLAKLEKALEPCDLLPTIKTYVLGKGHDRWALDADFDHEEGNKYREAEKRLSAKATQLGEDFATSPHTLEELGPDLFAVDWLPYRKPFGKGLAKGVPDLRECWEQLIIRLKLSSEDRQDVSVIGGFIEEVASVDYALSREFLDESAGHPDLSRVLVGLHPWSGFTVTDLDRCVALLNGVDVRPRMFEPILWQDNYAHLPIERIVDLAERLLNKPGGEDALLHGLTMRLHDKDTAVDTLGPELRRIGLQAAIKRFGGEGSDPGGSKDHDMKCVVSAALRFGGCDAEKEQWLDAIFEQVDRSYGYIPSFEGAISTTASSMPEAFLKRVFQGTEEQQSRRRFFLSHGGIDRSPLAEINVDSLIEWCQKRNQADAWGVVASGMKIWKGSDDDRVASLDGSAIKFLEASPEPELVLQAFQEHVTPMSWSGSRVAIMQPRADAISLLEQHPQKDIANAAKQASERLKQEIAHERMHEQRRDEEREQRFE